jgi:large subunit ribosomal protein L29
MPKAAELAELDDDELMTRLAEYRRELLNLRFQIATSQLDNPSRMAAARRDVARVLTLVREREIALAEGGEDPSVVAEHFRPVKQRPQASIYDEAVETEEAEQFEGVEEIEEDDEPVVAQDEAEGPLSSEDADDEAEEDE